MQFHFACPDQGLYCNMFHYRFAQNIRHLIQSVTNILSIYDTNRPTSDAANFAHYS